MRKLICGCLILITGVALAAEKRCYEVGQIGSSDFGEQLCLKPVTGAAPGLIDLTLTNNDAKSATLFIQVKLTAAARAMPRPDDPPVVLQLAGKRYRSGIERGILSLTIKGSVAGQLSHSDQSTIVLKFQNVPEGAEDKEGDGHTAIGDIYRLFAE